MTQMGIEYRHIYKDKLSLFTRFFRKETFTSLAFFSFGWTATDTNRSMKYFVTFEVSNKGTRRIVVGYPTDTSVGNPIDLLTKITAFAYVSGMFLNEIDEFKDLDLMRKLGRDVAEQSDPTLFQYIYKKNSEKLSAETKGNIVRFPSKKDDE